MKLASVRRQTRRRMRRAEFAAVSYVDPETLLVCRDTVAGYVARIFQHEVDHLSGIIYSDRTEDVWEVKEL